jgi:purine-binding chemotaxis protein CheW
VSVPSERAGERTRARLARLDRRRGDREKNLVGFTVAEVHYAIDVGRVREIIRPLPVVPLPHAPAAVIGVADHRSEVVPIVDLRRRFGLLEGARTRRTKWILVTMASRTIGFVVDAVSEVFGVAEADRRPVPAVGAGEGARGFHSVYAYRGALVFVLDVDRIGAVAELVDVDAAALPPGAMLPPGARGGAP